MDLLNIVDTGAVTDDQYVMQLTRGNGRGPGVKTLVVALAQLSAAAFLPAIDAHLDAGSFDAPVHMDTRDSDCAPTHDDFFCQVLRSLAHGSPAAFVSEAAPDAPLVVATLAASSSARARATRHSGSGPRAPPIS